MRHFKYRDPRTELDRWMREQGVTAERLSRQADVSLSVMHRIRHGGRASLRVAKRISDATEGQVSIESLLLGRWWEELQDDCG